MNDDKQEVFPGGAGGGGGGAQGAGEQVFLEGMKVLFDEKVGLYPVSLVARKARSRKEKR